GTVSDITAARAALDRIPLDGKPAYDEHDKPLPPALSDPLADVKRALGYSPATGAEVITGARFKAYLKSGLDTRVGDGAVLFQAVDQDFRDTDGSARPGLSYLRLGKPEAQLTDAAGSAPPRPLDRLMDQKYASGIGMFSDGPF